MPLTSIRIRGYRSIRSLRLPISACSVFVGANGTGKTNLYKALAHIQAAARGNIARTIAEEGGIESVLWAEARRRGLPVRLSLRADFDELALGHRPGLPHAYEIQLGLPRPTDAAFAIKPWIKTEQVTIHQRGRNVVMMERKGHR